MNTIAAIIERCEALYEDLDFKSIAEWRDANPRGRAIGYLPTYVPREVVHAAGCLPVGIVGAGEELEIVRGDACFQSYICHLPRSVVELGLSGRLDALDGMLFPSICDVIRNLSGVWTLLFPKKFVRYIDLPQNYESAIGGEFYRKLVLDLYRDLCALNDRKPDPEAVRASIRLYNTNRDAMTALYAARAAEPWRYPSTEVYLVSRAGMRLPVEQHTELVADYLRLAAERDAREVDNARVVVRGAFCEQPPLELIRTLERAGCWLVDDDLLPILRWPPNGVSPQGDPFTALSEAWLNLADEASSRYAVDPHAKGRMLVQAVEKSGAEGVIFAAPSFCDPALLDRPMLQGACDRAELAHTSFKYAENTGQMQPIREQAGTFADSIKLWGVA